MGSAHTLDEVDDMGIDLSPLNFASASRTWAQFDQAANHALMAGHGGVGFSPQIAPMTPGKHWDAEPANTLATPLKVLFSPGWGLNTPGRTPGSVAKGSIFGTGMSPMRDMAGIPANWDKFGISM